MLSVQRGHIPANLHFEKPNPHIPFDELRLKVVDEPTKWPVTGRRRVSEPSPPECRGPVELSGRRCVVRLDRAALDRGSAQIRTELCAHATDQRRSATRRRDNGSRRRMRSLRAGMIDERECRREIVRDLDRVLDARERQGAGHHHAGEPVRHDQHLSFEAGRPLAPLIAGRRREAERR